MALGSWEDHAEVFHASYKQCICLFFTKINTVLWAINNSENHLKSICLAGKIEINFKIKVDTI